MLRFQCVTACAVALHASAGLRAEPTIALSVTSGPGLSVEVWLSELADTPVAGYQINLSYDTDDFSFVAGQYDLGAFGLALLNPIPGGGGTVWLAAGINTFGGQQPVTGDVRVATLVFEPTESMCEPELLIVADAIPPTRLSNSMGQPILPLRLVSIERGCVADFDENGDIAVPDIFAFLSAWFGRSCRADVDDNGEIAVPDIFAFLSTWFARCA